MQRIPTLVGVGGHFEGEIFKLQYGKALIVGRSRTADFCLRRAAKYRALNQEQKEADKSARTVSGKHFQIKMYNLGSIEIKNLSRNGTKLDGQIIEMIVISDVASKVHEIKFGLEEILRLEMYAHDDE
ncbi:MAG: FHA domain-containing protein [Planctomycetota bacterium]